MKVRRDIVMGCCLHLSALSILLIRLTQLDWLYSVLLKIRDSAFQYKSIPSPRFMATPPGGGSVEEPRNKLQPLCFFPKILW